MNPRGLKINVPELIERKMAPRVSSRQAILRRAIFRELPCFGTDAFDDLRPFRWPTWMGNFQRHAKGESW